MAVFKIGDTVVLKSGSPTMTVEVVKDSRILCVWFDGTKKLEGGFVAEMLEIFHPDDEPLAMIVG
jgi:uncharacterized protein YodC (DUF2158 family)